MSVSCGLEWVVCLGCTRWAWKRLTYIGAYDSETWPAAAPGEFEAVPRICRVILAIYEDDLSNPKFAPPGRGYADVDPAGVVKRANYEHVGNTCPPYIVYVDHRHKEVVLAIRGLNLVRNADYKVVLMDNKLGMQMFDGGYVHHGLLKAAQFILERETKTLQELLQQNGPDYKLIFAGHSLGSGIAALMTVLVVNNRKMFGNIPRSQIRCYALAPARCMSLNLAVKYADVINSVVLQDDFLPRTPTPLEYIFGSIFCLPCLLFIMCLRDTFKQDKRKFKDPRRLYAPGRMYHIVERKFCRCGRFPPEVRTAIPVEGRFEHIVLSCSTTSDHAIAWIERESEKALELMKEHEKPTTPPAQQKMERLQSFEEEHKNALERAKTLDVPHAVDLSEVEIQEGASPTPPSDTHSETTSEEKSAGRTSWDELMDKLFTRDEGGKLVVKEDIKARNIVIE
uniref:Fungal lipase-like domain-containing protein n=1 Tax=Oryza punctata TaxID=4537 RepID=A0A0E0LA40_ORYPU